MTSPPYASRSNTIGARLTAAGFDPVGSTFVAIGGLLLLAAFTLLNWFRDGTGFFSGAAGHSTFSNLHDLLDQTARQVADNRISGHVSFGASRAYFGWLGWTLLLLALAFGVLAVSSFGQSTFLVRWLSAVVAATGVGVTFLALNLITFEGNAPNNAAAPSYGDYLSHTGLGSWCAIAGFVLVLVGCLVRRGVR
jgi:hypothetical protein